MFTKEEREAMNKNGLTVQTVTNRIKRNWDRDEAINVKYVEELDEYRMMKYEKQQIIKSKEIKAKYKKEKPWLKTVPQSKPLSKYGKHLSENIRIGAYKVDCYGRQQLI
ncbi:SA1788 family PVL leukocidin-associated protein [Staphylococcus chromogenes]|uniref:SA1788 family PVL leukocidin-associated protein n=1 Tax=Staphylococcus chromogenes TaxID=46126 RepID=UPI003D7BBBF9